MGTQTPTARVSPDVRNTTRTQLMIRIALVVAFLAQLSVNRGWIPIPSPQRALIFDALFLVAAVASWLRGERSPRERGAWRTFAIALVCWMFGVLHQAFVTNYSNEYPTLADAAFLAFYVLTYIAIALWARTHSAHFLPSSWLDGTIAGVGAAAIAATWVLAPTLRLTGSTVGAVATNLAYPIADLLLMASIILASNALRRMGSSWWLIAAGLGWFFIGDVYFLISRSTGGGGPPTGTLLAMAWPVGVLLVGWAATQHADSDQPVRPQQHRYAIPAFFSACAIGILIYGQRQELPVSALVFTVATLLLAVIRIALTTREVRALTASRQEARTDYLTGLPNRRHVVERLTAEVASAQTPTSLLIFDLDRFKEVNDSLGHVAGDDLLRQVGERLSRATGKVGLIARLGGDEFAVVLPNHDATRAAGVAATLRASMWDAFQVSGVPVAIYASVGLASAPEHGKTAAELLAQADIAMYQAKRSDLGIATYRPQRTDPSRDRLELLSDLRRALDEDQFVLYYQPQLDLTTDTVYGVEALVRWRHPRRGLLLPGDFLPVVTETRLMTALTEKVLRLALADRASLHRAGLSVRMSVNISASDLVNADLLALVEEILDEEAIGHSQLVLEVTEDDVISDHTRSREVLGKIRALGALVSVDDYGTGRASLSYLRDLPLDEIKLDRRFLRNAPADALNAAIVRSTIELAHTLGLSMVAEGVENAACLEWLRDLGCNIAQGYHIGRPMPLDNLSDWLQARTPATR